MRTLRSSDDGLVALKLNCHGTLLIQSARYETPRLIDGGAIHILKSGGNKGYQTDNWRQAVKGEHLCI